MHELFVISDKLPIPAGQSPFHVRGLYYDRLMKRVASLPGGLERLLLHLRDPGVREFIGQRFAWSRWYDALPTMPLYAALARVEGLDFETAVREGTRNGAHALVPSMFRSAMQFGGPGILAMRVTQVVLEFSDFARINLDPFEEGSGSGTGSGIPLYIAPNMANSVIGWFQGMLELMGAKEINGRYVEVALDGKKGDFQTVSIRFEFSWTIRDSRAPRTSIRPER